MKWNKQWFEEINFFSAPRAQFTQSLWFWTGVTRCSFVLVGGIGVVATIFQGGSHCVTPRLLTRSSCRHPDPCFVLLKVTFFRMSSERGGGGGGW